MDQKQPFLKQRKKKQKIEGSTTKEDATGEKMGFKNDTPSAGEL